MSDFLSSFGKIFLFCTFLPGLTGFILLMILFPNSRFLLKYDWYIISGIIYAIGFIANGFGHFIEVIINCLKYKIPIDKFGSNYVLLCKEDFQLKDNFREFYFSSENICIWYWNSATIILIIIALRILSYYILHSDLPIESLSSERFFQILIILLSIALVSALFFVTIIIRSWDDKTITRYSVKESLKK